MAAGPPSRGPSGRGARALAIGAAAAAVAAAAALGWVEPPPTTADLGPGAASPGAAPGLPAAAGGGAVAEPGRAAVSRDLLGRPDVVLVGSSGALTHLRRAVEDACTDPPLTCRGSGDLAALVAVRDGEADAAVLTVPFADLLRDPSLREVVLGRLEVVLVRHPDNPVAVLSREQLEALCRGRVRDWSELGGRRGAIRFASGFAGPSDEAAALGMEVALAGPRGLTAARVLGEAMRDHAALGLLPLAAARAACADGRELDLPRLQMTIAGAGPGADGGPGYDVRLVRRAAPRAPLAAFERFLGSEAGRRALARAFRTPR
jgi:phosphate transport system substrate-binding protein